MTVTKIIHIVNRGLEPLEVTDDGIVWTIRPGYVAAEKRDEAGDVLLDEAGDPVLEVIGAGPNGMVFMEPVPFFAAERAIRQNPVMGTEDPYNPNAFESMIAVPDWGHDYSYRDKGTAIERLDRSQLPEDAQRVQVITGVGRRPMQKKRNSKGRFVKVDPQARNIIGASQTLNPAGIATRIDG